MQLLGGLLSRGLQQRCLGSAQAGSGGLAEAACPCPGITAERLSSVGLLLWQLHPQLVLVIQHAAVSMHAACSKIRQTDLQQAMQPIQVVVK